MFVVLMMLLEYFPAITMTCPDVADKKEVTKKLPLTMTVQKLKQLVQRLFKADIGSMRLAYVSQEVGSLS